VLMVGGPSSGVIAEKLNVLPTPANCPHFEQGGAKGSERGGRGPTHLDWVILQRTAGQRVPTPPADKKVQATFLPLGARAADESSKRLGACSATFC